MVSMKPVSYTHLDVYKRQELKHTIKKFNVALDYARNGTDDMAIIQLKKVLNQNPNFIKMCIRDRLRVFYR